MIKKLKSFLKYTTIGIVVFVVVLVIVVAKFLFNNDAPIVSGDIEFGIKYKGGLELDVYRPTKMLSETSPVIFFIHGGAWIGGSKASVNYNRVNGAMNTLRDNGFTVISPNYSLAGNEHSVFPQCIEDVYDAIDWAKRNASVYSLDTTNIGLLGESAGAHIAMMIAFPDTTLHPKKYPKTKFNYLVDIYGPNNLTEIYQGNVMARIDASVKKVSKVFGSTFNIKEYVFGFDPTKDSVRAFELLHRFSPIHLVSKNKFPVLIIHGNADQVVPVEQSIFLKSKLDELAIPNEMHLLDSVDHNFRKATPEQKDSIQVWIADFVLKAGKN